MAYELNEEQLEIMHVVRDNLRARFRDDFSRGSEFICNQIEQVVHAREGDKDAYSLFEGDFELSNEGWATIKALRGAIRVAIDDEETLNAYIMERCGGSFYSCSYDVEMARLAWLDKIIETGAIA